MPRAIDPSLPAGGLPITHSPLNRLQFNVIPQEFDLAKFLEEILEGTIDSIENFLFPAIKSLTGIDLSALLPLLHLLELDFSTPEAFLASLWTALLSLPGALIGVIYSSLPSFEDFLQGFQTIIFGQVGALPYTLGFQLLPGASPLGALANNIRTLFTSIFGGIFSGIDFTNPSLNIPQVIESFATGLITAITGIIPSLTELFNGILTYLQRLIFGGTDVSAIPYALPFPAGSAAIGLFFSNLRGFFGDLDFLDPAFDVVEAIAKFITDRLNPLNLLATVHSLQGLLDTIWQAITGADRLDNLLSDVFDALKNIPFLNVLGIGGPLNIGATIQETWNQFIGGLVGATGSGAGLADLFNISQLVSSNASLGANSWDVLGIRSNKPLWGGLLPTGVSNIPLPLHTGTAPTFPLTQSSATMSFHTIDEGSNKGAVSWTGSGNSSITNFFVNIFKMNTDTGVLSLVHSSPNIIGDVSSALGWNLYTLQDGAGNPTPLAVLPGEVYGIELALRGAGTHNVVGQQTWVPNHTSVFPRNLAAVRNSGTSAPPSSIASGSVGYSQNVPFVEFAVTAGGFETHAPQIVSFLTAGSTTTPIPSWAHYADIVALGGGGGGHVGGTFGIGGEGGAAATWRTATWTRGTDFTGATVISVTVGGGGSGGSGSGANGGTTTVSISGHTVTSTGGAGANSFAVGGAEKTGESPGNKTYAGRTYVGGPAQNTFGANGSAPGGGGAGGNWVSFQGGGNGAVGAVWVVARA